MFKLHLVIKKFISEFTPNIPGLVIYIPKAGPLRLKDLTTYLLSYAQPRRRLRILIIEPLGSHEKALAIKPPLLTWYMSSI